MVENFTAEKPSTSVYLITGVRGSGKTVTMTALLDKLKKNNSFITITLNPTTNLLEGLAANLYEHPELKAAFIKADIKLSAVLDISIKAEGPAPNVEVQLKKMLSIVKKLNKRVLIAIDEVTNDNNFRVFTSAYQMFLIEKLPVYLVMTGLYKNINALQNEENLTFLYRAPKYQLEPLGIMQMAHYFEDTLGVTEEEAKTMAIFTKGYSYAFQVLGYLKYENKEKKLEAIVRQFDEYMEEYSYEKIWSELSNREREIVSLLAHSESGKMKVKEIKEQTGLTDQSFPTYKKRLAGSGVILVNTYGYCELALPRFKEIVINWLY
jgi:predicted AAA+ superfamily ATPase